MMSRPQSFRWQWLAATMLCIVAPLVQAMDASGNYLVDVWNSENGLPDSSVTALAQTPDGYLWVGTYNGLARFDGVRFVTFDPANTPALLHARVRRLSVDSQGTLWISTYDGSLSKYQSGVFSLEHRYTHAAEGEVTFVASTSNQVTFLTSRGEVLRKNCTAPAADGWDEIPPPARGIGAQCIQDANGTDWYRDGDKHLWRLTGTNFEAVPDAAGLAGQSVNCLAIDARGRLWVGTDHEFGFWTGTNFQSATPANTNAALNVECIALGTDDHIWAVANGCLCEAYEQRWLLEPAPPRNVFAGANGRIGAQVDGHGGMWFYNYGRGLVHVDNTGHFRLMSTEDGFPGARVYAFIQDREGDWWAGLDAVGLVRVRTPEFHTVPAEDKNLARAARTVCEDRDNTVWIGRLNGGLGAWQDGDFVNYAVASPGGDNSAFCVCPDPRGRLWLSADDENLMLRESSEIKRITPVIHGVKALLADHAGRIWAGTTTGLLVSENGAPDNFQPVRGLARRTIRALTEDSSGIIWGGTASGELFCITNSRVTIFQPKDGQESATIWSVYAEDNGTIWVGTFRGGLLRFRNGQFVRFGKKEGLPDNVICQILDDHLGNLWLGSHQGVFRVSKIDLNAAARETNGFVPCVTYGRSEGMPSQECSGGYEPAAWRDHQGRLWFTTSKGATWIQPEDIHANHTPPPVVIEDVLVDGQPQDLLQIGAALNISPGRHQIELRFSGLSLASPERVQFRYQLAGVDAGWTQAGTRRTAQYSFLPPGNYKFHVLACNSDGVWNQLGSTFAFNILPHYYETWWFQTLAAVVILGIVVGVVRNIATRRLRKKMAILERRQAIERERARIAKDIHDDLGANLTLIAVLGDLAKKEKTGERLEKMSATAREAIKSLDEIVWAVNPRNDTLSHLIDYMAQFAMDYLRDADIRCRLDVPDHTPAREVPANVRHNVFLVVKEALQNIVKHAHANEVWLRVNSGEVDLTISVEDNGCGFAGDPENAWADGLRNMRQRLAEIGGECRITSQLKVGTTITVSLQLPHLENRN